MDEALAEAAVDISGRAFLAWDVAFARAKVGEMDTELFEEFFRALAFNGAVHAAHDPQGRAAMPTTSRKPASRRSRGRCAWPCEPDPRAGGAIPSTKGAL